MNGYLLHMHTYEAFCNRFGERTILKQLVVLGIKEV